MINSWIQTFQWEARLLKYSVTYNVLCYEPVVSLYGDMVNSGSDDDSKDNGKLAAIVTLLSSVARKVQRQHTLWSTGSIF